MITNKKLSKGQYESVISETETEISFDGKIIIDKVNGFVTTTIPQIFENGFLGRQTSMEIGAQITSSRALTNTDVGYILEVNSFIDIDVTLNTDSFLEPSTIVHLDQINTGKANIIAGVGVTIQAKSGHLLSTNGQYTRLTIQKVGASTYRIISE